MSRRTLHALLIRRNCMRAASRDAKYCWTIQYVKIKRRNNERKRNRGMQMPRKGQKRALSLTVQLGEKTCGKSRCQKESASSSLVRLRKSQRVLTNSPSDRFDLFIVLHNLWMEYMSELLMLPPSSSGSTQHAQAQAASMHAKLIKADFHGAMISGRVLP